MGKRTLTSAMAIVFVLALTLAAGAVPAQAAPRSFVLTADMQERGNNSADGTFTITGEFSDSGRVTETYKLDGPTVDGVKTINGSKGTIMLHFLGNIAPTEDSAVMHVTGTWDLLSGTGEYAGITGQGTIDTMLNIQTGVLHAVYTGTADLSAPGAVGMPRTGGSGFPVEMWLLAACASALVCGASLRLKERRARAGR